MKRMLASIAVAVAVAFATPAWAEMVQMEDGTFKSYEDGQNLAMLGQYDEARKIFEALAAKKDFAGAYYSLGVMYYHGYGVDEDAAKTVEMMTAASERGHGIATYYMGWMYDTGNKLPQDPAKAAEWYVKSIEQSGYRRASFKLGLLYRDGRGVEQNPVQAYKWVLASADRRWPDAKKTLPELEAEMTPEQVAEATKAFEAWKADFVATHEDPSKRKKSFNMQKHIQSTTGQ